MTRDEFMELVRKLVGDRTDDETLEIIESLSTFYDEYENPTAVEEVIKEYEEKIKNVEKKWREKYRDAFFSGVKPNEEKEKEKEKIDEVENITIDDLFKEE